MVKKIRRQGQEYSFEDVDHAKKVVYAVVSVQENGRDPRLCYGLSYGTLQPFAYINRADAVKTAKAFGRDVIDGYYQVIKMKFAEKPKKVKWS